MRCGFCGYDFPEEEGIRGCANCPVSCGKNMVKCPRCNYENPPEPELFKVVRKKFGKKHPPQQ